MIALAGAARLRLGILKVELKLCRKGGIMRIKSLLLLLSLPVLLSACATAQIAQSTRGSYIGAPIHTVALAPVAVRWPTQ